MKETYKTPRLYTDQDLKPNTPVSLMPEQVHYLKSVLRIETGQQVRIFNGRNGEWISTLNKLDKKSASLTPDKQLKEQPSQPRALHLLFSPIKKNRMDFLIEKAVELGATDLHPVITAHTQVRILKMQRLEAQLIEAAEQCERLNLPKLHETQDLDKKIAAWSREIRIFWASERLKDARNIRDTLAPQAFLIGPEGGFNDHETIMLAQRHDIITPISLGSEILRAETAALYCLSQAKLCVKK